MALAVKVTLNPNTTNQPTNCIHQPFLRTFFVFVLQIFSYIDAFDVTQLLID